jgi:hypothetical protein
MEVVMRSVWVACAAVLAGCGGDSDCCELKFDAAVPDAGPGRVEVARVPVVVNVDVDMLFVIDDSPSMLDKQTNLKNSFPSFINELNLLPGGLPNVHIGVVSSDLGTKGAEDATAGPGIGSGPGSCSGTGKNGDLQTNGTSLVQGAFIADTKNTDGTRTKNYTGMLQDAFSAIASVGAGGCGFEQQIEAAKRALNNNPANAGFLRPNASLAIIILTDEDDCSIAHSTLLGSDTNTLGPLTSFRCVRFGITCDVGGTTSNEMNMVGAKSGCHSNESSAYLTRIAGYEQFFKSLKPDPNQIMISALRGNPTPVEVVLRTPPGGGAAIEAIEHSCSYDGAVGPEVADPGIRLTQFTASFSRGTSASVCTRDLSMPLTNVARQVRSLVGDTCLTQTIAIPADCIVADEINGVATPLPPCSGTVTTGCYELVTDTVACTLPQHLRLQVNRSTAPAPQTVVVASCKL